MSSLESSSDALGPHDCDIPFAVPLTHRLRFTRDVFGNDWGTLAKLLAPSEGRKARVQFWLDQNVAEARPGMREQIRHLVDYTPHLERAGNVQLAPGGESIKNDIHILERILKLFDAAGLDRRSYVAVVGGGALLDAVGFAAAIAHRGLRLVRLPTTTLSQGDSGVGVKNAVNLFRKKNWLGAFAAPWGVVNDESLLATLGNRDFVSGFSEVVKVALLKRPDLFERVCNDAWRIANREQNAYLPLLREAALMHLDHITQRGDPFEFDEARPLDYGHWSAHKLESMTDFELRHGEAVAIGVAIDTVYSSLKLGLPRQAAVQTLECLTNLGLRLDHPALADRVALFEGLEEFRQHLGGRLTLTMLRAVGDGVEVHEIDDAAMSAAIDFVIDFDRQRQQIEA